ncbi:hypothetical protein JDV02_005196 [Purpureocillium takamizusanense]|uniref:Uncharacterized protein n=1 Tax=Purpureocillium takamizusanense TaxID=2060973 RepID=A0A9Q8QHX5_9HYPO|nr:uncharacterized protein JDV02_005196 [Purpureocillium takamizusanense]UNI18967.1 hypothetical protein JDV02_005196 [Purpureocillium takamizusanense]
MTPRARTRWPAQPRSAADEKDFQMHGPFSSGRDSRACQQFVRSVIVSSASPFIPRQQRVTDVSYDHELYAFRMKLSDDWRWVTRGKQLVSCVQDHVWGFADDGVHALSLPKEAACKGKGCNIDSWP